MAKTYRDAAGVERPTQWWRLGRHVDLRSTLTEDSYFGSVWWDEPAAHRERRWTGLNATWCEGLIGEARARHAEREREEWVDAAMLGYEHTASTFPPDAMNAATLRPSG